MWILNFLPNWLFHILLIAGVLGIVASYAASIIPFLSLYTKPIRIASVVLVLIALWFEGGIANERVWQERVDELENKVKLIEAEAAKENVRVETKTIKKIEIIKQRGDDIIQYIDREVVKYDSMCVVPKEFVTAHNRAAERVE